MRMNYTIFKNYAQNSFLWLHLCWETTIKISPSSKKEIALFSKIRTVSPSTLSISIMLPLPFFYRVTKATNQQEAYYSPLILISITKATFYNQEALQQIWSLSIWCRTLLNSRMSLAKWQERPQLVESKEKRGPHRSMDRVALLSLPLEMRRWCSCSPHRRPKRKHSLWYKTSTTTTILTRLGSYSQCLSLSLTMASFNSALLFHQQTMLRTALVEQPSCRVISLQGLSTLEEEGKTCRICKIKVALSTISP